MRERNAIDRTLINIIILRFYDNEEVENLSLFDSLAIDPRKKYLIVERVKLSFLLRPHHGQLLPRSQIGLHESIDLARAKSVLERHSSLVRARI